MPEYLAPGVYIEETRIGRKPIEGESTAIAGFVGACLDGPTRGPAALVTSVGEFERTFGGLHDLEHGGVRVTNWIAHAVHAFFGNGGQRLHVARVLNEDDAQDGLVASEAPPPTRDGSGALELRFRARFPGRAGNRQVRVTGQRSRNLLTPGPDATLANARAGDVVEVSTEGALSSSVAMHRGSDSLSVNRLYWVELDNQETPRLFQETGAQNAERVPLDLESLGATGSVQRVTLTVEVRSSELDDGKSVHPDLGVHPDSDHGIAAFLSPGARGPRVCWEGSSTAVAAEECLAVCAALANDLDGRGGHEVTLTGGSDGAALEAAHYIGEGVGGTATGLAALGEVDTIALVAAPGAAGSESSETVRAVHQALIAHCETLRYRFAILSGQRDLDAVGIRAVRDQIDSSLAALYYPWVVVADPGSDPPENLSLPPDGFLAGIFARSDTERGVHKAPANEIVRGALRFSTPVDSATQAELNPLGINCLRSFAGRGHRVWGARTASSDPEWRYVNVRRLFLFLEHSIHRGTQWVIFEPNTEQLWSIVRMVVEAFLSAQWRAGALAGRKPEDAFFVRCDRETMTQADLDNGRLVLLVGAAPVRPAEFVIFRVAQRTAHAGGA